LTEPENKNFKSFQISKIFMDFTYLALLILPFTIVLVIIGGLAVDFCMFFIDKLKSFDIAEKTIDWMETDKILMKFTTPTILYGGCIWTFLGLVILIFQKFVPTINGLTVIGSGLTLIVYSLGVKKQLDDDFTNNNLQKKIKFLEDYTIPNPDVKRFSRYKKIFLKEHNRIRIFLYLAIGLVIVAITFIVVGYYGGYSIVDTVSISFIFLTSADANVLVFKDKYKKFVVEKEIDRILTFYNIDI